MKNVKMKDIADELGISIVTVSNALSNKNGVSEEIRQKVINTAQALGYHFEKHIIEKENNNSIAIIVSERYFTKYNSFYWGMYRKLAKKFYESNYFGGLEMLSHDGEKKLIMPNLLNGPGVRGIIVLGQVTDEYLKGLNAFGKPLILLDFYTKCSSYDTINTDNFYSSYLITNYLIDNGHREIGFVGDIHATSSILDRYLGYCKSLHEYNIPLNNEWLIKDRDEEGFFVDLKLPEKLPTSFVCNCDEVAYIMIEKLKSAGVRVPEDVSVVGFDDYIFSKISKPQITTVRVNSDKLTSNCVEFMLKKIKDADYSFGRNTIVGDLVFRESVIRVENKS